MTYMTKVLQGGGELHALRLVPYSDMVAREPKWYNDGPLSCNESFGSFKVS